MKKQAKDTKKKSSKVKDLSPKKDVKGGAGTPLRDKDGNLASPGKLPMR
jgi:hypothetical protein